MLAITLVSLACLAGLSVAQPSSGDCVCFTNTGVNVRSTPCGTVIGSTGTGACYKSKGGSQTCSLSGTTYTFWEFEFNGQSGWSANTYMAEEPASRCAACEGFNLISRAEWGARAPTGSSSLNTPVAKYFIHHATGPPCFTEADCKTRIRGIQNYHMDSNGWVDIGYSFLVGEDGNAYVGRGWDTLGAHTGGFNTVAHGICVMGDYMAAPPNAAALNTVQALMACGVAQNKIISNYALHGHRNGGSTACPGDQLYATIQGWPQFTPNT